jgi:hypothetical protein
VVRNGAGAVMVWGSEPPVFSIGWMEPLAEWDSGFTVLFDDAPDPEEVGQYSNPAEHPGISTIHLACLLEEHPEIGRGLDIARAHRLADLDERGEWVVGDVSRLEE